MLHGPSWSLKIPSSMTGPSAHCAQVSELLFQTGMDCVKELT